MIEVDFGFKLPAIDPFERKTKLYRAGNFQKHSFEIFLIIVNLMPLLVCQQFIFNVLLKLIKCQSVEISSEKPDLTVAQKVKYYFEIVEHCYRVDIAVGGNLLYLLFQFFDGLFRIFSVEMLL